MSYLWSKLWEEMKNVTNVKDMVGPALGLSQFFKESCRIQVEASHLMLVLLLHQMHHKFLFQLT